MNQAHAVRWSMRPSGIMERYSKWHWTMDGTTALCGAGIRVIGAGARLLPECDDHTTRVTCKRCKTALAKLE